MGNETSSEKKKSPAIEIPPGFFFFKKNP